MGVHKTGDTIGIYTFNSSLEKVVSYMAITSAADTPGSKSEIVASIKEIQAGGQAYPEKFHGEAIFYFNVAEGVDVGD